MKALKLLLIIGIVVSSLALLVSCKDEPESASYGKGLAFKKTSGTTCEVSGMGSYAFYDCSSLASISFAGTTTEWESVVKGNGWYYGVTATAVHCSDGDASIPQQEDES